VLCVATALEKKAPGGNLPELMDNPTVKEPETAEAGNTLECGDKSYKLTTGTDSGTCERIQIEGVPVHMICEDENGNRAAASCDTGCIKTEGAGDCDKK
jgi:hypothetical protein